MKTFDNVIQDLITANDKLLEGKIEVKTAKAIASNTQVIINAAKVYLEYMKLAGKKENEFFIESASQTIKEIKEYDKENPYPLGENKMP